MLARFLKDESGQDVVEYSLLLVLIGGTAVFVLTAMGANISNILARSTPSCKARTPRFLRNHPLSRHLGCQPVRTNAGERPTPRYAAHLR